MSSQTQNKQVPNSEELKSAAHIDSAALKKITQVPLISGTLSYGNSLVQAHPLLQHVVALNQSLLGLALYLASPVTSRLEPQLRYIDGCGANVINFLEQKFPYPFHVKPNELASDVKQPV